MTDIQKIAAIGGGVIGGGWVARFLLNGFDVSVYDPAPEARQRTEAMIEHGARALNKLTMIPLPKRGNLTFCDNLQDAVSDAGFIQESAPERLALKQSILKEIDHHAPSDALICSSTSGLMPTDLQKDLRHPERLMVGHPFNPVYLLPLVEICGGDLTSDQAKKTASDFYTSIGMKPLILRKEIDAFLADRIMEAYWREALWLVKDGVATVEEIDDAIRYGAGLRWAMMGTFQVYRVAGGDNGMRHFLSQFGPSLKWPWTKLMDVPDLDDDLINTIAEQSDDQANGMSIQQLEEKRDDGLVAILQALKNENWGAGNILKDYEKILYEKAVRQAQEKTVDYSKPIELHETTVNPGWVDYNGHMNESRYLQVFCDATDALFRHLGMDQEYVKAGHSIYTVETHIRHIQEVSQGKPIAVKTQLLGADEKRLRMLHILYRIDTEEVLATGEHLHVDMNASSACPFKPELKAAIDLMWTHHKKLPVPNYTGKGIRSLTG
jgi:carnitine 3-dehydrogenase / betainyl-CoA thioesterase